MKISRPEIREEGEQVKIQVTVDYANRQDVLWYAVDGRYREYLTTERSDGFVVALLPLALQLGEHIHVEGVLSEKLYYNLSHYYIHILATTIAGFREIDIYPDNVESSSLSNLGGVLTGFSAGIDSFCNVQDHYYSSLTPSGLKITHFNFNNVGSHNEWDAVKAKALFNKRYAKLKAFPALLSMDFIQVDSNLSDVLKLNFQQTHTPRNVSVALLFQKLFKRYYYASGHKYREIHVGPTKDTACHDPVALPLLSTETLECVATGSQYSRLQKTVIVANMEVARQYLDVCVTDPSGVRNCGGCFKCVRTLLTLEMLEKIDRFADLFDMKVWRRIRRRCVINMLRTRKDPFHAEIIEYARASNYRFPLHYKLLAGLRRAS